MILYAVHCKGKITNDECSILTIWDSLNAAQNAKDKYIYNWQKNDEDNMPEFSIIEIDTDQNGLIYDYHWYD